MPKKFKNRKTLPQKISQTRGERSPIWRRIYLSAFVLFLLLLLAGVVGAAFIYHTYSNDLPDVRVLKDFEPDIITRVYSDRDEMIGEFFIERRILVPLSRIPAKLKEATLAVEDSNFYSHPGIDIKAIFRASVANLMAGQVVEGGSTITQQLSKTFFLSSKKNIDRKIREAILSVRLEMVLTKDEILEMYLNQIYYGHGAYGVEAAAQTYFDKHVQDLTLEECALLVGLPKAPTHYSPYRDPDKALDRRNHSLRRMATLGFISQKEAEQAMKTPIRLKNHTVKTARAAYFVEYIRQFLQEKYGSSTLYRDGLKVYTTLDSTLQNHAENAVRAHLRESDKRYGYRGALEHIEVPQLEETIVRQLTELNRFKEQSVLKENEIYRGLVLDIADENVSVHLGLGTGQLNIKNMDWARPPNIQVDGSWARIRKPSQALSSGDIILVRTLGKNKEGRWNLALEQEPEVEAGLLSLDYQGNIKAMVGGYDFGRSQFNRSLQALRQPGSAFKPIIYSAAVAEGFTPTTIIMDSPIIFKEEDKFDKWKPANFEEKFYGPTPLRTALAHSRNVVTIKVLQSIGVKKAVQMARSLGITAPLENNLSLALGTSPITLYDMISAYSSIANLGRLYTPSAIRYIKDRNDKTIYQHEPAFRQAIPSGVSRVMSSLMESVVHEGTATKVKALGRPVAGKTGTTNNYNDAWFIGFTAELITGVWVGKDKDEPLGVNETGARAAIPMWLQFMEDALRGAPILNFPTSPEVSYVRVNSASGKSTDAGDPESQFEIYLNDHLPEINTRFAPQTTIQNF